MRRSISSANQAKGAQAKGYLGANQSRMAMSKNILILPDMKTEKMNIPTPRTATQVIFFRILSLFEIDTVKNLIEILKVENRLL